MADAFGDDFDLAVVRHRLERLIARRSDVGLTEGEEREYAALLQDELRFLRARASAAF